MKNLKLSFAVLLLSLISVSVNAQTTITPTATKVQKVTTIDKNSDYMSVEMENKIKNFLISGEIPSSLPKYVSGTKADYNKILKAWAKENLNLIKAEYHDKVLGTVRNKKSASRKE